VIHILLSSKTFGNYDEFNPIEKVSILKMFSVAHYAVTVREFIYITSCYTQYFLFTHILQNNATHNCQAWKTSCCYVGLCFSSPLKIMWWNLRFPTSKKFFKETLKNFQLEERWKNVSTKAIIRNVNKTSLLTHFGIISVVPLELININSPC